MAVKVKEGLFLGDMDTSQDPDFCRSFTIEYFINCAGLDVPFIWGDAGDGEGPFPCLTFCWQDDSSFCLFDAHGIVLEQIVAFIDEGMSDGVSVLVYSRQGTSRCVACVMAYMMYKYCWGFDKVYEYLKCKRADIEPNEGFFQQLHDLDWQLQRSRLRKLANLPDPHRHQTLDYLRTKLLEWSIQGLQVVPPGWKPDEHTADELVLVNSFINSQTPIDRFQLPSPAQCDAHKATALRWADNDTGLSFERPEEQQPIKEVRHFDLNDPVLDWCAKPGAEAVLEVDNTPAYDFPPPHMLPNGMGMGMGDAEEDALYDFDFMGDGGGDMISVRSVP